MLTNLKQLIWGVAILGCSWLNIDPVQASTLQKVSRRTVSVASECRRPLSAMDRLNRQIDRLDIFRDSNHEKTVFLECCETTRLKVDDLDFIKEHQIVPFSLRKDPYYTGKNNAEHPDIKPITLELEDYPADSIEEHYRSTLKQSSINPSESFPEFKIPHGLAFEILRQKPGENEKEYFQRRLRDEVSQTTHFAFSEFTEIGEGATSHVFVNHAPLPARDELSKEYPHVKAPPNEIGQRLANEWILDPTHIQNASAEVIKLRTKSVFGTVDLKKSSRMALRDFVMGQVFDHLASHAHYFRDGDAKKAGPDQVGQPLIRFSKYRSNLEELSKGILRQETVSGPSAFDIAEILRRTRRPAQKEEALKELTEKCGFTDRQDAANRVLALEAFYREAHLPALHYQVVNHLKGPANRFYLWTEPALSSEGSVHTKEESNDKPIQVGLDYNQGRNVIWDSKQKVWVAIDL